VNSIWNALVGLTVTIALLWGLITFNLIPPEILSESAVQTIREIKYAELQLLFILGGDPINAPYIIHGILLNVDQFLVLNMLMWGLTGLIAGVLSRGPLKGIGAGISASILCVILCWFLYWGIIHSFEISATMSEQMFYVLKLWCIEGLKTCIPSSVGGLIGGSIMKNRKITFKNLTARTF